MYSLSQIFSSLKDVEVKYWNNKTQCYEVNPNPCGIEEITFVKYNEEFGAYMRNIIHKAGPVAFSEAMERLTDIELVESQCPGVKREEAVRALVKFQWDIVDAIMSFE